MRKLLYTLFCYTASVTLGCAQLHTAHWHLLDTGSGLSSNQVRGITQASNGLMVIKTTEQINVYNGVTVQHYPYERTHHYAWSYDGVSKEYHDHQGRVWMKAREHLTLLDLHTGQYVSDITGQLALMGMERPIKDLFVDDQQCFWMVTADNDIVTYDTTERKIRTLLHGSTAKMLRYGKLLEMTRYKNFCWLLFDSGTLVCLDYVSGEVVTEESYFAGRSPIGHTQQSEVRVKLHPDLHGNLWIAIGQCIYHYDRLERVCKEVYAINGKDNFFTCMDIDRHGNVWAGTSKSGIVTIGHDTHEATLTPEFNIPGYGTIHNDTQDIYCDDAGGVWVGTLFMGLCYHHPMMNRFGYASTSNSIQQITNENVRCFLPCPDGTVLVGSGHGLFRFAPQTGSMTRLFEVAENDIVISLYRDSRGRTWAGTFLNSYYLIGDNCIRGSQLSTQPNANVGRTMCEDSEGRLWISTNAGIALYDDHTLSIEHLLTESHPELSQHKSIQALYPDSDGRGFTALGFTGIFHYDTHNDKVSIPTWAEELGIQHDNAYCMLRDGRGILWIGTSQGIILYDTQHKRELGRLTTDKGLNNNNVFSITATPEGDIWAGTDNGVSRIVVSEEADVYRFHIQSYDQNDGVQPGKFYENAICCTPDGKVFFGGVNGLSYIDATTMDDMVLPQHQPIFTSLQLFGQEIATGKEHGKRIVLPGNICYTRELTFRHNQNNITLSFSPLKYPGNKHLHYRYKLHGNDKDWSEGRANGLGQITYTDVRPGNYTLEVCCRTATGEWSTQSATIGIRVKPPFWSTWWARLIYLLLLAVLSYYAYRMGQHHRRSMLLQEAKAQRQQQQEELNQMKFRFFTNVSHEFRTPLTLIITPLEAILHRNTDIRLQEQLKPIYANAQRLLQLVNQLLDFRRLEMGGEQLTLKTGELVRFIDDLCNNFKDTAEEKQIALTFDSEVEYLYIAFDSDKVYKIIANLLSNAFKYTPAGGKVNVLIGTDEDRQHARITVSDTGQGIDPDELHHIWKRFYQAEAQEKSPSLKGSGIGLHMVKEYTEMHQGHIDVQSQPGQGTTFTVYMPTTLHPTQEHAEETTTESQENVGSEEAGKHSILVVDDNDEFRHFMTSQLKAEGYTVLEAADGVEAETMAIAHNPSIVVTDLMMPRRDGIELTHVLKANIAISHIPVILLTAKAGDEAKIDAYRAGADDYIAKPFNYELLLLRIQQLIEQQRQRQQQFKTSIDITPSKIAVTSLDEELIRRAMEVIEKHISDGEFGIEQLAAEVAMSKTHLNRKIQGIAGMTPLQFIRSIRLKRAAQLLRDSQYNISEIAYMAGFNTLKYFNKHFKEEFGMTPTQYREEHGTK